MGIWTVRVQFNGYSTSPEIQAAKAGKRFLPLPQISEDELIEERMEGATAIGAW